MPVYKREVAYAKWSDRATAQYQSVNEKLNGMSVDGYGRMTQYPQPPEMQTARPVVLMDQGDTITYSAYEDRGDLPVAIYRYSEV